MMVKSDNYADGIATMFSVAAYMWMSAVAGITLSDSTVLLLELANVHASGSPGSTVRCWPTISEPRSLLDSARLDFHITLPAF